MNILTRWYNLTADEKKLWCLKVMVYAVAFTAIMSLGIVW